MTRTSAFTASFLIFFFTFQDLSERLSREQEFYSTSDSRTLRLKTLPRSLDGQSTIDSFRAACNDRPAVAFVIADDDSASS